MFIDSAKILIKSGDGGNGAVSFHREKYVAKGGPDGGDGGKGGDVVFVATNDMRTLADFRYKRKYQAQNGQNGGANNCTGKSASNLYIKVPTGTIIKNDADNTMIADLTKDGQSIVVLKGGKGGAGNQHFATSTRQIPSFAKLGESGAELSVRLELKMLADVGLIGYPNVGKSTILSMITNANPKIADYHFTTITPNLGVVNLGDNQSFTIADIPGLIEGANEGLGLGHEFLKHIERTKLLLHVIDIASVEGRDPLKDFEVINNELKNYNEELSKRPQIVVANKIDILNDGSTLDKFIMELKKRGVEVFPVSAATNNGLSDLIFYINSVLKSLPEDRLDYIEEPEFVYKPCAKEDVEVVKNGDVYLVRGEWARKLVGSTNMSSYESLQYFQKALIKKGVMKQLEDLGLKDGDTVIVHDFEFDYVK